MSLKKCRNMNIYIKKYFLKKCLSWSYISNTDDLSLQYK